MSLLPSLPRYWRTGDGQTLVLGMIFFMIFLAYFMLQGYSANLFGPKLGSDVLTVLYAAFTVFCFVSPSIVNTVGPRLTLFFGTLSYAVLVLSSLAYMVGAVGPWVVILGGAINGIGSACTWTAQGRLMLQYADGEHASGKVFQVFWSFFMGSAIIGGLVTFAYFSNTNSSGNVPLFVFFFFLIVLASMGTIFLIPPEDVIRSGGNGNETGSSSVSYESKYQPAPISSPLLDDAGADGAGGGGGTRNNIGNDDGDGENDNDDDEDGGGGEDYFGSGAGNATRSARTTTDGRGGSVFARIASSSFVHEVRETVAMAKDRRMRRASLLFLYVGLNQPYQGEFA